MYEGPYRIGAQSNSEPANHLLGLFDDWRQRIYRFDNRFGASVILYQPLGRDRLRWDLVVARFLGRDPFDFRYADGIVPDLRWRDIQSFLDRIKSR